MSKQSGRPGRSRSRSVVSGPNPCGSNPTAYEAIGNDLSPEEQVRRLAVIANRNVSTAVAGEHYANDSQRGQQPKRDMMNEDVTLV